MTEMRKTILTSAEPRKFLTERSVSRAVRCTAIFDQSPDAQMVLDEDLVVVDCNENAVALFAAHDKSALLGLGPFALSPEQQADGRPTPEVARQMLELARVHGAHRFEWLHRRLDGQLITAEVAITWLDIDGTRLLFASAHDATDRKRAEQDVLASREAAIEASRLKSQFLANMSHEIRTPMHGVLGMLALALGTELSTEQREFLGAARASAEALLDIINDILDLSKLEAGKLSIEEDDVSLDDVLRASLQPTSIKAHAKSIEMLVRVDPDVPAEFISDSVRIRQVLINLLGNAIKFTDAGEVTLHVSTLREPSGLKLFFAVQDTGIGIAPDRQATIFDAFQQADNSTTRRYGGTGLGLTICKELVQRMGGGLQLSSVEGKGSTFSFTIALVPIERSEPAPSSAIDLRGWNILVVDDHDGARRALTAELELAGARVSVATNAHDALARVQELKRLDAAFLDHRLAHGGDGLELGRRLRRLPASAQARLVLLRSHERVGRDALSQAGFSFALDKPVLAGDVMRALTAPVERAPSMQRFASLPERAERTPSVAPLALLVVEDHPINAHFMTSILRRWGHEVVHASDGSKGLAAVRNRRFDLVLMDVQMPVMDGLEATRRIRGEEDPGQRIPIIALTANAMKGDEEECLQAGMDAYLSKPIDPDVLMATLARFADKEKLARSPVGSLPPSVVEVRGMEQLRTATGLEDTPPFANDALLERAAGDPRFQADLIRIFIDSQDEMMRDIEGAVSCLDPLAVRHAAHRVKGALQLVCAGPAADVAMELERAAREGRVATFQASLARLQHEMRRLRRALGDFVEPLAMGPQE